MLMTVLIWAAFLVLLTWSACSFIGAKKHGQRAKLAQLKPIEVRSVFPETGHCVLCNARLAPTGTTCDQAVFEIERRIADEQVAVCQLLAAPERENLMRLYVA